MDFDFRRRDWLAKGQSFQLHSPKALVCESRQMPYKIGDRNKAKAVIEPNEANLQQQLINFRWIKWLSRRITGSIPSAALSDDRCWRMLLLTEINQRDSCPRN